MLTKSPNRRPSVMQLCRFKWLADIEKCSPILPSEPSLIPLEGLPLFAPPPSSGAELLCGTTVPRPQCRMSLVCPPTLHLAAEMKVNSIACLCLLLRSLPKYPCHNRLFQVDATLVLYARCFFASTANDKDRCKCIGPR